MHIFKPRGYKKWDSDGLGEEKMAKAMLLVLGDEPISARNACREVFGAKFPNVHRTLGNLYKNKFKESIGLAKKLNKEQRKARRKIINDEWVSLPRPGNPNWVAYLTPDEEQLVCSFLQTCNYMHMPFNRDAFKVSAMLLPYSFTHIVVCLLFLTHSQHIRRDSCVQSQR